MAIDIGFYYRILGGGTGALDAEPVSNLDDGALANVVDEGNGWFYVFNASSGKAPDGYRIVAPLYADSESTEYTGDGRWELQTTIKAEGVTVFNPPEIEAGECSEAVSATAIGVLESDVVNWGFTGDVTSITGYGANGVNIVAYPTADSVNFKACNNTASAITPGLIRLNWNVVRGATTPSLPLVLNSATIGADGETWTFVFNKSAKFGAGGSGGFAVTMTGAGAITLTYASGSGTNTWTYTGDKTVYEDDTVSVGLDYTQPTDGIQDDDDVDMISFSSFSVINNSEEGLEGVGIDLLLEYSVFPFTLRASCTLDKPANTTDGDFLLAVLCLPDNTSATMDVPLGWTLLASEIHSDGDRGRILAYHKRADNEGEDWTWSFSGGVNVAGIVKRFTGVVSTGNPLDVAVSTGETGYSLSPLTCPSITTISDNAAIVLVGYTQSGVNFGDDHSLTNRVTVGGTRQLILDADIQETAGATGDQTVSVVDYTRTVGILMALKPG